MKVHINNFYPIFHTKKIISCINLFSRNQKKKGKIHTHINPSLLLNMLERTILKLPVERVIERAGNAHNYQIRVLGLFSIQWFLAAIIFVAYNFLFETPKLTCANSETPKFECTAQQACSGNFTYSYDLQNGPNTLISEFDLICDQEYFNSLGE